MSSEQFDDWRLRADLATHGLRYVIDCYKKWKRAMQNQYERMPTRALLESVITQAQGDYHEGGFTWCGKREFLYAKQVLSTRLKHRGVIEQEQET